MRTNTTLLTLTLGLAFIASAAVYAETEREAAPKTETAAEEPAYPVGDITEDGSVNVNDFLALIAGWGACPADLATQPCKGDLDGDKLVGVSDLLMILAHWD
jgi:hypothetical protein